MCLLEVLFAEAGDYRLLEVKQNQRPSCAILSGCCDHMGQHMGPFPSPSPGLFRHVSGALIMHFSAWGENWSIWAGLASVPCGSPPAQSINSAPCTTVCTQHTHIKTHKHTKTNTHTEFTYVPFRSLCLFCPLFRPTCFRPFPYCHHAF